MSLEKAQLNQNKNKFSILAIKKLKIEDITNNNFSNQGENNGKIQRTLQM